jgi:hypothetical protein
MTLVRCLGAETLECFLHNTMLENSSKCIHFREHTLCHGLCIKKTWCGVLTEWNLHKCICKEVNKNEV